MHDELAVQTGHGDPLVAHQQRASFAPEIAPAFGAGVAPVSGSMVDVRHDLDRPLLVGVHRSPKPTVHHLRLAVDCRRHVGQESTSAPEGRRQEVLSCPL